MRWWTAALTAGLVAGCQAREPETARTSAQPIRPGLSWSMAVSGSGASLRLSDAAAAPVLSLACVRGPARMTVTVESFTPVGSEERLSFGVDDEPFAFVADLGAGRPHGVEAAGPVNEDLLSRLEQATSIGASYGAQTLGPRLPPTPEQARSFTRACREVVRAG